MQPLYKSDSILAYTQRIDQPCEVRLRDVPAAEKLEKLVEDVRYGIYPLTAFATKRIASVRIRALSPDAAESVKSTTPEPIDVESREVVNMMCSVKPRDTVSNEYMMTLLLRMDDKMNRQLTCQVSLDDSPMLLANELVHLGFIHENDREKILSLIENTLRTFLQNPAPQTQSAQAPQSAMLPPAHTTLQLQAGPTDIKQNQMH